MCDVRCAMIGLYKFICILNIEGKVILCCVNVFLAKLFSFVHKPTENERRKKNRVKEGDIEWKIKKKNHQILKVEWTTNISFRLISWTHNNINSPFRTHIAGVQSNVSFIWIQVKPFSQLLSVVAMKLFNKRNSMVCDMKSVLYRLLHSFKEKKNEKLYFIRGGSTCVRRAVGSNGFKYIWQILFDAKNTIIYD